MQRIRSDTDLERLEGERDDLRVRLSLLKESDPPDMAELFNLQRELAQVEREIANHVPSHDA